MREHVTPVGNYRGGPCHKLSLCMCHAVQNCHGQTSIWWAYPLVKKGGSVHDHQQPKETRQNFGKPQAPRKANKNETTRVTWATQSTWSYPLSRANKRPAPLLLYKIVQAVEFNTSCSSTSQIQGNVAQEYKELQYFFRNSLVSTSSGISWSMQPQDPHHPRCQRCSCGASCGTCSRRPPSSATATSSVSLVRNLSHPYSLVPRKVHHLHLPRAASLHANSSYELCN